MGKQVNSPYDELNPVFTPDGNSLFFTRRRHPENTGGRKDPGDIWLSKKDDAGNWAPAVNAGENLNNGYFNSVAGFSPDGNTIYLQHHYFKKGLRPSTQGLSFATKTNDGWSDPRELKIENFLNESQHQSTSISADGKVMIFAIDSYGSYGYEDLYVGFRNSDGSWTTPKNLGGIINTDHQEMTPYIGRDNMTLYFASSGHNSMGSRDIFVSKRLDNSWRVWSKPENLKAINSEGIELSFIIDPEQKLAYFISTQNSDGYGDINKIALNPEFQPVDTASLANMELVEPDTVIIISQNDTVVDIQTEPEIVKEEVSEMETFKISGRIYNQKSEEPINAKVSLIPIVKNQDYEPLAIQVESGNYSFEIDKGIQYKLKVSAEGFLAVEQKIDESKVFEGALEQNFYLTPLEEGATFQIDNVLFERGTASLVDSSYLELDKVVEMMTENPELKIEIGGHTDNQGDARLNLRLSEQRVGTVVNYLIEKGIEKNRIVGKGYGGTKPIASNRSENTRKLNRRVEFTILEAD
ncbi:MAG TPA: OmpA family protein [Salinimicrobium sp.]|nr:OmpA family protein [Salinimicrobium sp.]